MQYLNQYKEADIASFFSPRNNEIKLGQALRLLPQENYHSSLVELRESGVRFALLGIPEDIGPRGNHGLGGSHKGWQAFLKSFLNLQANSFIAADSICIIGEVELGDLQKQTQGLNAANSEEEAGALRLACAEIDNRVAAICQPIFEAGLIPIVIGGGHNNAFPLLCAASQAKKEPLAAVNMDPHSDFRPLEGRHSGNGFSYASCEGHLSHYYVVGLHELKNSQASLASISDKGFKYDSYQSIWVRQALSYQDSLSKATQYLLSSNREVGVELDVDSISYLPVSAYTNCGITVSQAEQYVYQMSCNTPAAYLHLAEAAPERHPVSEAQGEKETGQVLSALVNAFLLGQAEKTQ